MFVFGCPKSFTGFIYRLGAPVSQNLIKRRMNVYSLFVAILLAFVTLIRLSVEVSNIDEQVTGHVLTAAIVERTRHVSQNVYDPTQTKQTTNRTKRK